MRKGIEFVSSLPPCLFWRFEYLRLAEGIEDLLTELGYILSCSCHLRETLFHRIRFSQLRSLE